MNTVSKVKSDPYAGFLTWLKERNAYLKLGQTGSNMLVDPVTETVTPLGNISFFWCDYLEEQQLPVVIFNPAWLSQLELGLPRVARHIFNPSLPYGVTNLQQFDGSGVERRVRVFNTFKKYYRRLVDVDYAPFIAHLERLFPSITDREVFTSYLAHMLQRPEERPSFSLCIPSDTGTGKGFTFHEVITPLLCGQTIHYSNYNKLTAAHNMDLSDKLCILFDDPPQATRRVAEELKSIQTEPTVMLRPLYERGRKEDTYTRFFLFSNLINPLELDDNDRRWYVFNYVEHLISPEETAAHIRGFSAWLSDGGLDAVHHYLMNYDLSGFDSKTPPDSAAKRAMIEASKPDWQSVIDVFVSEVKVFRWADLINHLNDQRIYPDRDKDVSEYLRSEHQYVKKQATVNSIRAMWWHPANYSHKG